MPSWHQWEYDWFIIDYLHVMVRLTICGQHKEHYLSILRILLAVLQSWPAVCGVWVICFYDLPSLIISFSQLTILEVLQSRDIEMERKTEVSSEEENSLTFPSDCVKVPDNVGSKSSLCNKYGWSFSLVLTTLSMHYQDWPADGAPEEPGEGHGV